MEAESGNLSVPLAFVSVVAPALLRSQHMLGPLWSRPQTGLGVPWPCTHETDPPTSLAAPPAPPSSGEPCGWARACGESHPSIILVADRHEADGDNIPSPLPTDELLPP